MRYAYFHIAMILSSIWYTTLFTVCTHIASSKEVNNKMKAHSYKSWVLPHHLLEFARGRPCPMLSVFCRAGKSAAILKKVVPLVSSRPLYRRLHVERTFIFLNCVPFLTDLRIIAYIFDVYYARISYSYIIIFVNYYYGDWLLLKMKAAVYFLVWCALRKEFYFY